MIFWILIAQVWSSPYQTLMNKQAFLQCKVEKLKVAGDLNLEKVKEIKTVCQQAADLKEKEWESRVEEKNCEWKPCQKHALKSEEELCLNDWIKSSQNQKLQDCLLTTVHDACQDTFATLGAQKPRKIYWKNGTDEGYWFCSPKVK